jgi:hypothetical protein
MHLTAVLGNSTSPARNKGMGGALGDILGGLQNSGDAKAKQQQPLANPLG